MQKIFGVTVLIFTYAANTPFLSKFHSNLKQNMSKYMKNSIRTYLNLKVGKFKVLGKL